MGYSHFVTRGVYASKAPNTVGKRKQTSVRERQIGGADAALGAELLAEESPSAANGRGEYKPNMQAQHAQRGVLLTQCVACSRTLPQCAQILPSGQ